MPRTLKQSKSIIVDGHVLLSKGDGTIKRDLKAAASRLDQAAELDKSSYTLDGRFANKDEGNEYKEKRRLAKRLRAIARTRTP